MFLGLDLGTTNIKALVVTADGRVVAEGSAPVDRSYTTGQGTTGQGTGVKGANGQGVEQDIDQIWTRTCLAIRKAVAEVDAREIQAVGVSSQGAALQWLDGDGFPVGPVISWLDSRGNSFADRATAELGEAYLIEHIGRCRCAPLAGQLFRLKEQAPQLFTSPKQIGFVGDVIVHKLCGHRAHDATSLSIASLLNPSLGEADSDMAARLGTCSQELPDLLPVTTPAGPLRQDAAQQTGLCEGIPVSGAIHDQYSAGIGSGSVNAGDVYLGTGTAWVLVANTTELGRPITPEAFVCPHPIPGLFGQLLSMGNGGSSLQWALSLVGDGQLNRSEIDQRLDAASPGSDGLCFWPLLLPTEQADRFSKAGGRLAGISLAHSSNHLLRAVVEGLACELARHIGFFEEAGFRVERLVVCGDAAASAVTPQIIADVTGRSVACVSGPSVSAFGAALVAQSLLDDGHDLASLSRRLAPARQTVHPGADAAMYRQLRQEYLAAFA